MANEIFTRIQLKYDSYQNWDAVKATFKPLKGELCVVNPGDKLNDATTVPCLLKVGDGEHFFKDLPWISATAADVYAWAKCKTVELDNGVIKFHNGDKTKPVHTIDLTDFVNGQIADVTGDLTGLNTAAKTTLVAAINEVRQAVEVGGTGSVVTIAKLATPTAGSAATYQLYQGSDENGSPIPVGDKIEIPVSTKVEASEKEGYIKVDNVEVQVYDEVFGVDMATVNALGGITAGTNLKDKTIHEVLNALLFPYVKPTVGNPSRVPNTTAALEKGNNQTITQVSATVTKKSAAITKVELLKGSEVIATKEGTDLPNITTSGTTVTFSGLNIAVPSSSVTLKIRVTDAEGSTVTSGDTAGWTFVYPYYYGVCAGTKTAATLTEADIEAMTKDIKGKGEKSYTYTTDYERMVIAYPKAHGALKKILDSNGFDYLATGFERDELSITGLDGTAQTYYVYAQKDPSGVEGFTMRFQY